MTPAPPQQCSIALWQGYVYAQFYARDPDDGGMLVLSPAFRTWRPPWQQSLPIREDPTALAALKALKTELRLRGWVRMGRVPGGDWYQSQFRLGRRHGELDGAHRLAATVAVERVDR